MIRAVPERLAVDLRPAAKVFAEHGVDRARIEDVSATTGVATSTIYYYFSGKEDLAAFLLGDWLEAMSTAVETALAGDGTVSGRLTRVIRAQVQLMVEHPDPSRILLSGSGRIAQSPSIQQQVHASFHRPVEKLVAAGAADGTMRAIDPEAASALIFGAVTVATLHFLAGDDPVNPDELAQTISEVVLRGVVAT